MKEFKYVVTDNEGQKVRFHSQHLTPFVYFLPVS